MTSPPSGQYQITQLGNVREQLTESRYIKMKQLGVDLRPFNLTLLPGRMEDLLFSFE